MTESRDEEQGTPLFKTLLTVRYGIPAVLVAAGLVCLFAVDWPEGAEAFSLFAGAGLSVLLLNVLYRVGVRGDTERDDEEQARAHFAEHGEWPDERERPKRSWNLPQDVATPESEARAAEAALGEDANE